MKMKSAQPKTCAKADGTKRVDCLFAVPVSFGAAIQVHHEKVRITPKSMKSIRTLCLTFLAATVLNSSFVLAQDKPAAKKSDIVAVAVGAGSFNTLVAAVKAAGLVETLQGAGPFTVFAPTDEAFAKLPKGTVEDLLKPENKEKLVAILTYHVVAGKVMAADVKTAKVKTVNGKELDVKVADGAVTVDGAKVVKVDIAASNGVIHVIDSVLLPK